MGRLEVCNAICLDDRNRLTVKAMYCYIEMSTFLVSQVNRMAMRDVWYAIVLRSAMHCAAL